jgi:hypothetical protein
MIAQADKDYGLRTTKFTYRVVTNNEKLYKTLKADKTLENEFRNFEVILEGGKK